MFNSENLAATQKSALNTLFGFGAKALEGMEQLVALNLQVGRTALTEAHESAQAALSAKDAQDLAGVQAGLLQPAAEKLAAYQRHVASIITSTGAELRKAGEALASEMQGSFVAAIDAAAANAPEGSGHIVSLMRSTMANANSAIETAQKAAKQAGDIAQANFNAAAQSVGKQGKSSRVVA